MFIQGKIQTRSWDDKQSGRKLYRTEIVVHDLTLLGGGQAVDEVYHRGRRRNELVKGTERDQQPDSGYRDQELSPDEIPF